MLLGQRGDKGDKDLSMKLSVAWCHVTKKCHSQVVHCVTEHHLNITIKPDTELLVVVLTVINCFVER